MSLLTRALLLHGGADCMQVHRHTAAHRCATRCITPILACSLVQQALTHSSQPAVHSACASDWLRNAAAGPPPAATASRSAATAAQTASHELAASGAARQPSGRSADRSRIAFTNATSSAGCVSGSISAGARGRSQLDLIGAQTDLPAIWPLYEACRLVAAWAKYFIRNTHWRGWS